MTEKIVFLDIDGTLLDENYRSNDPSLKRTITEQQAEGVIFCLNSNRSLEDLLPIAKRFCIQGPLIGENGIFSYDPKTQQTRYFVEPSHLSAFVEQKQIHERLILQTINELYGDTNVAWINADTVNVLTHKPSLDNIAEDSIVALNNMYRRYTSSVHILKKVGNRLVPIEEKHLASITDIVSQKAGKQKRMDINYSSSFSNILLTPSETSKRRAVKILLKDHKIDSQYVFGIGDEYNDYRMIQGSGTFLTINNANEKVKKVSKISATKPYAKGVHELILKV